MVRMLTAHWGVITFPVTSQHLYKWYIDTRQLLSMNQSEEHGSGKCLTRKRSVASYSCTSDRAWWDLIQQRKHTFCYKSWEVLGLRKPEASNFGERASLRMLEPQFFTNKIGPVKLTVIVTVFLAKIGVIWNTSKEIYTEPYKK